MALAVPPVRVSTSMAPSIRRSTMKALKRLATMPMRVPRASIWPLNWLTVNSAGGVGFIEDMGVKVQCRQRLVHDERDDLGERQAIAFQAGNLLGVVGHQAHVLHPELAQDLGAKPEVAQLAAVRRRCAGVHHVRLQIMTERISPRRENVKQDAATGAVDGLERRLKLPP